MKGYSKERRDAVIAKMTGPNRKSIAELVEQEQICAATLYKLRTQARAEGRVMPEGDDTPEGWGARDKFNAVLETATLSEQEVSEYCRRNGLYTEQILRWHQICADANEWETASSKELARARREDRDRIKGLERELRRKEKALAETAALLVLRKKWRRSEGTTRTPDKRPGSPKNTEACQRSNEEGSHTGKGLSGSRRSVAVK